MANLQGQKAFLAAQGEVAGAVLKLSAATTTTNPTLAQVKQFINDACREILYEFPYLSLFNTTTVTATANTTAVAALDDTAETILYMVIQANQQQLRPYNWEQWRAEYPSGYTGMAYGRPQYYIPAGYAANHAKQVYWWPSPDANYTVEYGFIKRYTELSGDTDLLPPEPEIQDVIMNRAIYKAYRYLGAMDRAMVYDDSIRGTSAWLRYNRAWRKNEEAMPKIIGTAQVSVTNHPYTEY